MASPKPDDPVEINVGIYETLLFLLFNLIYLMIGFIFWHVLWVTRHGVEIPNLISKNTITYFSSRNFSLVLKEIWERMWKLDRNYLTSAIGYEAYNFLLYQRTILSTLFWYFLISIFLFLCRTYGHVFFPKEKDLIQFLSVSNITGILLITFFHFRGFAKLKKEAFHLYFSRFMKMSENKDVNWLSCRTLHISGINPQERLTSLMQTKLNVFLSKSGSGKVLDITFIPNYNKLLKYEKERNEINDLRLLITHEKPCMRCLFSSVYWSDNSMKNELQRIQEKIDEITEEPVFSSGHAFVCFDSLTAAYKVMNEFKSSPLMRFKLRMKNFMSGVKENLLGGKSNELISGQKAKSTFQKFHEDYNIGSLEDNYFFEENSEYEIKENMNILVDQLIEPIDIVWVNIGGDKGLYVFRRIFLNLSLILLLIFFTTPMGIVSAFKKVDKYQILEFKWLKVIPFGYILVTYIIPLLIIGINLLLICAIDFICRFEKHYTHSNYQFALFTKSFVYMLFNYLIIPSLTLSYESLYDIIKTNYKNILHLLSQISSVFDNYYFFIALIIQNGTVSFVYYFLRLDELMFNAFSTQVSFYKRHFINTGHAWHRNEEDCFYYGYFCAQYMVFYSICIVFANFNPLLPLAGIYLFLIRHFGDFTSLLTVHLNEIDSNGKFINKIINYAIVPILLFQTFMIFDCINNDKFIEAGIVGVIMLSSIIYFYITYDSDYMMAIYSYNKQLDNYENNNININSLSGSGFNIPSAVANNEIIKWNNKYRHPLIIPAFESTENNNNIIQSSYPKDSVRKKRRDEEINVRPFEPRNRRDE
jgi:hypothetical protein